MRFLTMGEAEYMDAEKRNEILRQIADGHAKEATIQATLSTLPPTMPAPFQEDQKSFEDTMRTYQSANPIVKSLESRLMTDPGPAWRPPTQQEQTALTTWTKALGDMDGIVASHFPTEIASDAKKFILLLIGIGAIAAPLFFSSGGEVGLPFRMGPPPLPPVTPTPVRTPRPISSYQATPIRPDVIRPTVTTIPGGAAPRPFQYRSFTRPQTPSPGPVPSPASVAAAPAGGPPPGAFAFPRFQR